MRHFLILLLAVSVGGTVLVGILCLIKTLLHKRISYRFAYYLWLLVILRLCLPFGVAFRVLPNDWSVSQLTPSPDPTTFTLVELYGMPESVDTVVLPTSTAEADMAELRGPVTLNAADSALEETGINASYNDFRQLWRKPGAWVTLWAIGAAAFLFRYLWRYFRYIRILRRSSSLPDSADLEIFREFPAHRRITLLCSSSVHSPLLSGLFRPTLFLPPGAYAASGKAEELRDVFRHELSHFKRGDLYYAWLVALASCFHWFNPVMPFVRREILRLRELACDEAVIHEFDKQQRQHYGETLLNQAATQSLPLGALNTALAESNNGLTERILAIRSFRPRTLPEIAISILLALCLIACSSLVTDESNIAEPIYPTADTAQEALYSLRESILIQLLPPTSQFDSATVQFVMPDYAGITDFNIALRGQVLDSQGDSKPVTWFDEYNDLWVPGRYAFTPQDWEDYSELVLVVALPGTEGFEIDLLSLYLQADNHSVGVS